MKLDLGPADSSSALVWIEYARKVLREVGNEPASAERPADDALAAFERYLEEWEAAARAADGDGTFRWTGDVDPDVAEYLVNALYRLSMRLRREVEAGRREPGPAEGRQFYILLVHQLLELLEREDPSRAEFVRQLRDEWPVAGTS